MRGEGATQENIMPSSFNSPSIKTSHSHPPSFQTLTAISITSSSTAKTAMPLPHPHYHTSPLNMNEALGAAASWKNTEADAKLAFSRLEFPYEFGLKSDLTSSPADSLATTESEEEEEEEEFFAELNRRLTLSESRKVSPLDLIQPPQVPKVSGGSPQSILGGIGNWSGRSTNGSHQWPSPPATPYEVEYDTFGLIYAAAGQVERLKMNIESPLKTSKSELNHNLPVQNHKASFMAEQNYMVAARRAYNAALLYEHYLQNNSARYSDPVTSVNSNLLTPSQWLSLQTAQQRQGRVPVRADFQSTPLQRTESVGTGVFLPRGYSTAPVAPPRKRATTTNAIVPAKVVQALNMSFEEMNSRTRPSYNAYAASVSHKNFEAFMARRNAFVAQQQRRVARTDDLAQSNLEVCLPQEWSY